MIEQNELEKKWHKLLKILEKKEIIDWDEKNNLELEEYKRRKEEAYWNS